MKGLEEINRSKPEQISSKQCDLKLCWKLLFSAFFLYLGISQEKEECKGLSAQGKGRIMSLYALSTCSVGLGEAGHQKQHCWHPGTGWGSQCDSFPWLMVQGNRCCWRAGGWCWLWVVSIFQYVLMIGVLQTEVKLQGHSIYSYSWAPGGAVPRSISLEVSIVILPLFLTLVYGSEFCPACGKGVGGNWRRQTELLHKENESLWFSFRIEREEVGIWNTKWNGGAKHKLLFCCGGRGLQR